MPITYESLLAAYSSHFNAAFGAYGMRDIYRDNDYAMGLADASVYAADEALTALGNELLTSANRAYDTASLWAYSGRE